MKKEKRVTRKYKEFFKEANRVMSKQAAKLADTRAKEIVSFLRLAEARQKMGYRQTELKPFSQSEISKIEHRSDIKLSTLIEYMQSIGMGIKIVGIPKEEEQEEFVILAAKAS